MLGYLIASSAPFPSLPMARVSVAKWAKNDIEKLSITSTMVYTRLGKLRFHFLSQYNCEHIVKKIGLIVRQL